MTCKAEWKTLYNTTYNFGGWMNAHPARCVIALRRHGFSKRQDYRGFRPNYVLNPHSFNLVKDMTAI